MSDDQDVSIDFEHDTDFLAAASGQDFPQNDVTTTPTATSSSSTTCDSDKDAEWFSFWFYVLLLIVLVSVITSSVYMLIQGRRYRIMRSQLDQSVPT